jgi:PAS domain S-box-containing protein
MSKDIAINSGTPAPLETSTKAFRNSEARYRRLFEAAQDGILLINADTAQIEDVNPYLISLLGYTHSEFLGKKLWEIGAFADIVESRRMFAELREKGYVRYENLPLITSAGTQLEVEFVSNTYDCEGTTVIQCNIRDISERRLIEARLHSAEDKFRDLVDQAIAGVLIIQDYKVSYVNPG